MAEDGLFKASATGESGRVESRNDDARYQHQRSGSKNCRYKLESNAGVYRSAEFVVPTLVHKILLS